jgi:hypothetical protein
MGYRWLAEVIVAAHFGFLGYVVLGGFLAWRRPWAAAPHLLAAGWGLLVVTYPIDCPLTVAEDWARARGGGPVDPRGFIDRYLENVLYPERYSGPLRVLVAVMVAASYLGAWLWARRRTRRVQRASVNTTPSTISTTIDRRNAQAS